MNDKEKQMLTTNVGVRGNVRAITITDNVSEHFDSLVSIAKANYDFYAYIYHDRDETEKHIHLLCITRGGTTLKNHIERFSSVVPANFVCKVKNPRAMAKYLIHRGYPTKFQYDVKDVITNSYEKYSSMIADGYTDSKEIWRAFCDMKQGRITAEEFIDMFPSDFASMPFYQKCSLYNKIYDYFGGATHNFPPKK